MSELNDASPRLVELKVEPGTLRWSGRADRLDMALFVDLDDESIQLAGRAEDEKVRVRIMGRVAAPDEKVTVHLGIGRTVVPVEMVAADGQVLRTYRLRVFRAHPKPDWRLAAGEAQWTPRDSAGELVFKDHLWIFGGYTPEVVHDVWRSPDGSNWERMPDIPAEDGVNIPVCFVFEDKMWVTSQSGKLFNSPDGTQWTLVNEAAPWAPRRIAGGLAFDGRMWVIGGEHHGQTCSDVWSSADGINWTRELEHAPWAPRQCGEGALVFKDAMWVVGGGVHRNNYHPFKAYRDVWRSRNGRDWEQVTDCAPWPARVWNSCAVYRDRMWIFGGFRSGPDWRNFDDVWYSRDGKTWDQLHTSHIWSPRHEVSPYVFRDRLWVVAGNAWPLLNDAWSLHIPGLVFLTEPVEEDFVGAMYTYRAKADFHASGKPLSYRLTQGPDWLSIDPDAGVVRGTPPEVGEYPVTVEAIDPDGERAEQRYVLYVLP